jgi:excisionase family DNA binding protein
MSPKIPAPPVVIDANQRYSVPEACALLRLSRSWVFKEIRSGRLRVFKDGRRTYVHGTTLIERCRPPADQCAA